jgi:H+/gluconate symporter-like permease
LISLALSVNILAGIKGSASGGVSIALQTLRSNYVQMAREAGISLELMHRVTTVATGGLDSLPHNGAIVTLLAISKLTHRQAYKDISLPPYLHHCFPSLC